MLKTTTMTLCVQRILMILTVQFAPYEWTIPCDFYLCQKNEKKVNNFFLINAIKDYFCGSISRIIKKKNFMKKDIHPKGYRKVIFKDIATDDMFLTGSAANSKENIVWEDGNTYPLIKMEISAFSHPFFTGKQKFVDTAGRIDKFNKKFGKFAK